MSSDDIARLIYLGLLGSVIVGGFFLADRLPMRKTIAQALAWVALFLAVMIGYNYVNGGVGSTITLHQTRPFDEKPMVQNGNEIIVPQASDGHYYVTLQINGTPVNFVVDTGASSVVLTAHDARRVGLDPKQLVYLGRASTANGETRTARVKFDDVRLGGFDEGRLRAYVNEGSLDISLLGMEYLDRFSQIQIRDGELILTR